MSRLQEIAARHAVQLAALDAAIAAVEGIDGLIVELGLGGGGSYDHLRERLPGRELRIFDRAVSCNPRYAPPAGQLVLGEMSETLPAFRAAHAGRVALAHSDIGTRNPRRDQPFVDFVAGELRRLMTPGGVVVSDRPMDVAGWQPIPFTPARVPGAIADWPYYLYRAGT